jgi:tetratricopeptide (TPR) repeat protein
MGWLTKLFGGGSAPRALDEARALAADGRLDEAVARFDAHLAQHPNDVPAYAELARVLVKAGREAEAAEFIFETEAATPMVLLAQGETYAATGRLEEALEALERAREWYKSELGTNYHATYAREGYAEASLLFDGIYAEMHGHEKVVVEHATRGRLDAQAGVNYRLLGNSLMVGSAHRPETLHLESVAATRRRLEALAPDERKAVRGQLLLGAIAMREGDAKDAAAAFERAAAQDGTHFAAFRGLGAAKDMANAGWPRPLKGLPSFSIDGWRGLDSVAPDLPNFTDVERRLVLCAVAPLRHALPLLARDGKTVRVMPLDVRTTDHPDFAGDEDHRFADDHRALSALSGVAGAKLALVRLDELLDVGIEQGWVFAHEFAHLAHRCMADGPRAEVSRWYARARQAGYVASSYALKNEHEFFAVLYEDYVLRRYELGARREADDLGVFDGMMALFDRLDADPTAFRQPE